MERCIYDLIIGNDIYKHGSVRYEVEQSQSEGDGRMVDMIFENSKLGSDTPQLEVECVKCDKQSEQSGGVIVNKQTAVEDDQKSEVEVEELHSAAVQTRR